MLLLDLKVGYFRDNSFSSLNVTGITGVSSEHVNLGKLDDFTDISSNYHVSYYDQYNENQDLSMIIIDFEKETFGGYSFNGVQTFYENFNDQTIVGSETTHSSNISSGGFDGQGYALKLSGVDSKRWTQVKTETGGDLYGISMTSVSFWHYPVPRYSSSDGSNYPRIFVVIWNDNNETEWQAKTVLGMAIAGNNVPMKYHDY